MLVYGGLFSRGIQYSGGVEPEAEHKERGRVNRAAVSNFSQGSK